ncbi:TetR/AcrR family transcriptional regulator [Phenylobacterium sp.]|uniref:TetR/AcrR family transcriptional regulator n=1 Tax=Phenylobacterium sp. TaxID=1871053 RepID=UPI00289D15F4|nr:TetR/AcrR family transcriptional regulator [Phenylobacterium sp.]
MKKGAATREAIVGRALQQAVTLGLEGLSLGPLADSLELSKSGLFAHFKSKEALQLAVLEEAIERFRARVIEPALAQPRGRARMDALIGRWFDWVDGEPDMRGCIFAVSAQEYDDRPGLIRDRLVASQREWHDTLARIAADLPKAGRAPPDYCRQLVFELIGVSLAYQQQAKLFRAPNARALAEEAVARILDDAGAAL